MNISRLFERDKIVDQAIGLAFGIGVAVLLAVGLQVYDAVHDAPDEALLDTAFWAQVGLGVVITAIRSLGTALGTAFGLNIRGVSSASPPG